MSVTYTITSTSTNATFYYNSFNAGLLFPVGTYTLVFTSIPTGTIFNLIATGGGGGGGVGTPPTGTNVGGGGGGGGGTTYYPGYPIQINVSYLLTIGAGGIPGGITGGDTTFVDGNETYISYGGGCGVVPGVQSYCNGNGGSGGSVNTAHGGGGGGGGLYYWAYANQYVIGGISGDGGTNATGTNPGTRGQSGPINTRSNNIGSPGSGTAGQGGNSYYAVNTSNYTTFPFTTSSTSQLYLGGGAGGTTYSINNNVSPNVNYLFYGGGGSGAAGGGGGPTSSWGTTPTAGNGNSPAFGGGSSSGGYSSASIFVGGPGVILIWWNI